LYHGELDIAGSRNCSRHKRRQFASRSRSIHVSWRH
jgi:hypothetical protein